MRKNKRNNNVKPIHFIPANSGGKAACGSLVGKKTRITYLACTTTCVPCKVEINEPVDFNKGLVE